jgi:hypothetical protein
MRIYDCLLVSAALVVLPAVPDAAHEGHESCAGGAVGLVPASGGPSPEPTFGLFASNLAKQGLADETVAVIHESYCEKHAPRE